MLFKAFSGCQDDKQRYFHWQMSTVVLRSAKAGLRASEIANLTWDMVLGPTGQISGTIELRDSAAKRGGGRSPSSMASRTGSRKA